MPGKKKPAKRMNWKARALHCEEVIGVQNQIARVQEQKLADTEKQVAALLAQREEANRREIAVAAVSQQGKGPTFWTIKAPCPRPTLWQRLTSWWR